ncbi:MAG: zinc ribbon domain-containing protein [Candidatus Heimdallarchaeaceae archaeon]
MSNNRYYSKKDYKGDFSAFGTAIVFTLIGILSLAFRTYSIPFLGLSNWGYWFFIPAFFTFISAFGHLYSDRRMRNNVFTSVSNRSGRVKLESLSQETGISPKNLLRILIDLRTSKGIKYSYDTETGEIIFGESIAYHRSPDFVSPLSKKQAETIFPPGEVTYCPYCGHKTSSEVQFCENCGSKLQ